MKNIAKFLVCALFLYLYIYSPALHFLPFGLDKIIFAISFFYLLFSRKAGKFLRMFKNELVLLLLIVFLSVAVSTLHKGFSFEGIMMYDIFLLFEILLVPFAMVSLFSFKWECNVSEIIIYNAVIAGSITVALLLNPEWADLMKNQILRVQESLTTNLIYRGFGFSDGLTFAYPVVQGLCAGFVICGFVRNRPVYYMGLIPIVISIFVNARSGVIPIGVAIILVILKSPVSKTIKTAVPILAIIALIVVFYEPENDQLFRSMEWGLSFFQIMIDFFSGKEVENMDVLTGSMVQFPHSFIAWLMGEGVNLFDGKYQDYNQSDIGFCIRTVYGGVFYMTLWVVLWLVMFRRLMKVHHNMALLLFISLLYFNWKSDFFIVTASCRFFFLLYVWCIMDSSFMKFENTNKKKTEVK